MLLRFRICENISIVKSSGRMSLLDLLIIAKACSRFSKNAHRVSILTSPTRRQTPRRKSISVSRFATIVFDFDGTIANTLPLIYQTFNTVLEPRIGRTLPDVEIRSHFGPPDQVILG